MCVILEPRHWRPLQLVAKRIQHFDPTLMYFESHKFGSSMGLKPLLRDPFHSISISYLDPKEFTLGFWVQGMNKLK